MGTESAELTSYVGRRQESADLLRRLSTGRLVTVTGPGGVGKTRLATRVMRETADRFDHRVFVGLAELDDPGLLPNLVAARLGLGDAGGRPIMDTVLDNLRDSVTLLLLDNCEHVVDRCAEFVARVLEHCPGVTVLATSRQSLGVPGEQTVPLAPLPLPPEAGDLSGDALTSYDGVRLFVERATAAWPAFTLTPANSADVVRLCGRLDGLPLAIELAAARVRSLSPGQIADRLTGDLALLDTGSRGASKRQSTLRAAIDWSFDLCSPAERALWARASVFVGSFDLDAAEQVCVGGTDPAIERDLVLGLVDSLVDKSVLVREDQEGVGRYRLLETLRQYGQERLDAAGDRHRTQRRHRDWCARLVARAGAEWTSPAQVEWTKRLRADQANLRAALDWSVREPGEAAAAVWMVVDTTEYWTVCGSNIEARTWLDRAMAALPADHPDRPRALAGSALFALLHSDPARALDRLAEAHQLSGALPEGPRAVALAHVAHVRSLAGLMTFDPATPELAATAVAAFRAQGDVRRELHPLFVLAIATAYASPDVADARAVLDRMTTLTESCEEFYYRSMCYHAIAFVEVEFGDVDVAAKAGHEALAATEPLHNQVGAAYVTETLAWIADRQGDHVRAATLFGVAARLWHANGATAEVAVSLPHRRHLRSTVEALGQARFDRAFAAGRAKSDVRGRVYALNADAAPADAEDTPLSPREVEIAGLVAAGMTNRAIGLKLVIAPRTVDTHVRNILTKLDFHNRAQIASWFTARRS
ncbi:Predicted ATPase [Actinokineospora alba]|uniref:Predicted ATPase n=1 Tax=Actinokineospora alba TaxID=504798 RepID=A0A1H0KKM0_9PSEU|nr:LuxR C-terminal-related transcriptional regulator [Actinokineospora alba]TDP67864.1 putative ATPase [Actinokineospora alba]SDH87823.1 Predicted ATPase [Actinokineospora alba]SDO56498.1 Predicted ATPase [Actinokineospora alba]